MMLYQTGFNITIMDGQKALALAEFAAECVGECKAEDLPPNIEINRSGHYTVSADIRLPNANSRAALHAMVQGLIGEAVPGTYGFLAKHDCRHDENRSCSKPEIMEWGADNV